MAQVLAFSLTAMANPTLIGVTTLMLLLPSPKKLMLGYLLGAYFTSITVGIIIVLTAENSGLVSSGKKTINPIVDLALGAILVVIGLVLRAGRDRPVRERRAERKAQKPPKTPRWQKVLSRGDPKIAFVVGALLTLPGASYLAALTSIAKLHPSTAGAVLLVIMVNLIMLALLEVPLLCFLVAPEWTPNAIERAKDAMRRRGRRILIRGFLIVGVLLIVRGVIELISA
jgi:Sap, sulfolipid-1-addressing protein